jgi:hypothetical protein
MDRETDMNIDRDMNTDRDRNTAIVHKCTNQKCVHKTVRMFIKHAANHTS